MKPAMTVPALPVLGRKIRKKTRPSWDNLCLKFKQKKIWGWMFLPHMSLLWNIKFKTSSGRQGLHTNAAPRGLVLSCSGSQCATETRAQTKGWEKGYRV